MDGMSLPAPPQPTDRRPTARRRPALAAALALLLAGCAPASGGGTTSTPGASSGLGAAATGVCAALKALPDTVAAERAFTDDAHEALHALASAPGLERSLAAPVLEIMQRVEADFATTPASPDASRLATDLASLHAAASAALAALGATAPACP
jgi:hypothetical protein